MPSSVTSTLSWKKLLAQARRQEPDHPVEDDLEHRQALVGHDAGIDDRSDASGAGRGELVQREADELIDLPLRQERSAPGRSFASPAPSSIMVAHSAAMSLASVEAPC